MTIEVTSASRILVGGGVANLVLSFLLGWVPSAKRMKEPMDRHRWLLVAHEVALQEGLLLLGVAVAIPYARVSPGVAEVAAWLLVVASVFQDASGIANWLRGIGDQFAQKSAGWVLATVNAIVNSVGLGIVAYGVACGLASSCCDYFASHGAETAGYVPPIAAKQGPRETVESEEAHGFAAARDGAATPVRSRRCGGRDSGVQRKRLSAGRTVRGNGERARADEWVAVRQFEQRERWGERGERRRQRGRQW